MELTGTVVVILTSLTALPIMYCVNLIPYLNEKPFIIFAIGATVLGFIFAVPFIYNKKYPRKQGSMYTVWSIFTFAAVVDFTIALENEGLGQNFMLFYVLGGEPYLKTEHGTMINFYDGILHFIMYLVILTAIDKGESYRDVGIYWAGSIVNSVIVLFLGSVLSKFGVTWSVLLNIPYLVVPMWVAFKLMSSPRDVHVKARRYNSSLLDRPAELVFFIYFLLSTAVIIFKGVATLGCKAGITRSYITNYEPYLLDPIAFPKVQILEYLFYFVPVSVCFMYCLLVPSASRQWMLDWALLYAGASANGQFALMGAQLHPKTDKASRLPDTSEAKAVFWVVNLALTIVPQLFAYYCYHQSYRGHPGGHKAEHVTHEPSFARAPQPYNLRRRNLRSHEDH